MEIKEEKKIIIVEFFRGDIKQKKIHAKVRKKKLFLLSYQN